MVGWKWLEYARASSHNGFRKEGEGKMRENERRERNETRHAPFNNYLPIRMAKASLENYLNPP